MHANTTKTTFGCKEAHIEVHKNILCNVEFLMKSRASYKYMDTRILIRLIMFQIKYQPVVSCFLLEMVLLVGVVRNNQHLHYQARRSNTEAQQSLHVK
jgi:hypothetical protein